MPRQELGGMEAGLMAYLKALRAIISEERVKERTEKIEEIKKKMKR